MTEQTRLKLIVRTPDGQESEAYIDWSMISGLPELLLPNVQQLAWDMLPDAEEILAHYVDDEGDRCTLIESTAADALSFTKPGGDEAEKVLEVIVRSIGTDAADVDLEAAAEVGEEPPEIAAVTVPQPPEIATVTVPRPESLAWGAFVESYHRLKKATTSGKEEQYGSEPQPNSSSGSGTCSTKTTTTLTEASQAATVHAFCRSLPEQDDRPGCLEGGASCDDFTVGHPLLCKGEEAIIVDPAVETVELGVSMETNDTSEALSAPPVEVMGESSTASAEPTTVSAPRQHRFVRHKVACEEPAQEDAPVQHRFSRHKAEDVLRFKEEVELYLKQAEEARLEAEKGKKEAEAARAAEATLRAEISSQKVRDADLHDKIVEECEKADAELRVLRCDLANKIQENEELQMQMTECKQAHEEEAQKLRASSWDDSRELWKKLAEVESERSKVERLSEEVAEVRQHLGAAHVQIEEMQLQVEEAAAAADEANESAQAAEEARREADTANTAAAQAAQQQAELLRSKEVEMKDLKVAVKGLKSLLATTSAEAKEAISTLEQVRADLDSSVAHRDGLQVQLEQKTALCEALQAKEDAFEAQLGQKTAINAEWLAKAAAFEAQLGQKTAVCDDLQAKVDSLQAQLGQKTAFCDDLQAKSDSVQAQLRQNTALCEALQVKALEQLAMKQSKASAVVTDSQPLLFGIEAEEEPSARCDVTARSAELLAKLGARQAFCIGRVRMAAGGIEPATGRPSAAVPASVMVTVTNNGSVDWPSTAVITNVSDDCLGAPVIPLGPVRVGGSKEVEMDLNVPSKPEATTAQYLWSVMDARTSAVLGAVLIFEAVWDSP